MTIYEVSQLLIAGMSGGVLRSIHFRQGWKGYTTNIIAGGLIGYYLGRDGAIVLGILLGNFINTSELSNRTELVAFILGAGGVAIVGWVYDLVEIRMYRAKKGK